MKGPKVVYLDYAAGSPLLPSVADSISHWLEREFVNPSSIHTQGRQAAAMLDQLRRKTASLISAKPGEVIFTSGGTEANNLALLGYARANVARGRHIISCATEHPSVIRSLERLQQGSGGLVSKHELPGRLFFLESFAETGSGKIDRQKTLQLLGTSIN